ncbi:MAG TPA: hypothetical protein VHH36_03755 [Candidatus Thermoplasmatota archaeon]|nr:hypothetical protein [Candidatus Thermoplasmatota archaeon]
MTPKQTALLAVASLLLPVSVVEAHFPVAPNLRCSAPSKGAAHDFAASTVDASTGPTGEVSFGAVVVLDGAATPCGTQDLCPSGENFLAFDPSGDDLPDGTDPSGDDVVVTCDDILVGGAQVPVGDGDPEFGIGGAFLPAAHHDPLGLGYYVEAVLADGGFSFGSDGDGDGDIEEGADDCLESHAASGNYVTACAAGADGGWWFFAKCGAAAASDWAIVTDGGPVRGLDDADADGVPDFAEDGDGDSIPDGLQDGDGDKLPDVVTKGWGATLVPGSLPPDASADCLAYGHIDDGACFCPLPPPTSLCPLVSHEMWCPYDPAAINLYADDLGAMVLAEAYECGDVEAGPLHAGASPDPLAQTYAVECTALAPGAHACGIARIRVEAIGTGAAVGATTCVEDGGDDDAASCTAIPPDKTGCGNSVFGDVYDRIRCEVTLSPGVQANAKCNVD